MPSRALIAAVAAGSIMLIGIGCGDDNNSSSSSQATTTSSGQEGEQGATSKPTIDMSDYAFTPQNVTVPSGKVTITAPNKGKVEHELVLMKTDQDPAKLKTEKNGEVEEDAYQVPGEKPDVEPGDTGKKTFSNLKPGKYAMVCNVPGHYKAGMYGSLTVE